MTEERLVQPAPRLMEINWFWRRLWSFGVTIALLAIVAALVWLLGRAGVSDAQAGAFQSVAYAALALIAFVGSIYVGGATVYEIWQLVAAARVDRALVSGVAAVGERVRQRETFP